jgi:hypothetical protein
VTALLIASFIDNLVDALGLHIHEEAEKLGRRRVSADVLGNLAVRLAIGVTFVAAVLALPGAYAVAGSLLLGIVLLSGLTWRVARHRRANPALEVGKHMAAAAAIVIISGIIGHARGGPSVERASPLADGVATAPMISRQPRQAVAAELSHRGRGLRGL